MPYVTFESMEHEETTNLAEKSTILDGRRRRRRRRRRKKRRRMRRRMRSMLRVGSAPIGRSLRA